MRKRVTAAVIAALIWAALIRFTTWDISPAQWEPVGRFSAAAIAFLLGAFAFAWPYSDED